MKFKISCNKTNNTQPILDASVDAEHKRSPDAVHEGALETQPQETSLATAPTNWNCRLLQKLEEDRMLNIQSVNRHFRSLSESILHVLEGAAN